MSDVKIGALCWNQYTEWPRLLEAGVRADAFGYDTLWTCGTSFRPASVARSATEPDVEAPRARAGPNGP